LYVCQCGKNIKVTALPSGASAKGSLPSAPGHYSRQLWEQIFPARVFPALPSVVARSSRQKKVFLKNKKTSLLTVSTTLSNGFLQKNGKYIFADGRMLALGTYFLRNIKNPFFANGTVMRPSAKKISKTVNFTPC
jgi:hypothetical protein